MDFKKKIVGPKNKSAKWELRRPTTTLALYGNMAESLGACVSHDTWSWTPEDVVMSAPNAEQFANKLERGVNKDYADWFRRELNLTVADRVDAVEFENLKIEIIHSKKGLVPVVTKQATELGKWLRTERTHSGIKFACRACPQVLANKLYLGGVNDDGVLTTERDSSPDQASKSVAERITVSETVLKALISLGKANPDKFGAFKTSSIQQPDESPVMSDSYIVEFENIKVVVSKPDSKHIRIEVPRQTPSIGAWLYNRRREGEFSFEAMNTPELKSSTMFVAGCREDGTLKTGPNATGKTFDYTDPLSSKLPILKAFRSLGLKNPDKFGRLVSSNLPTDSESSSATESAASSTSLFVEFDNLKVVMTKSDSTLRIRVPKQDPKVGKYLYSARPSEGFWFETAGSPEFRGKKLFLHGCNDEGRLRDNERAGDATETSEASVDSLKKVLSALCALAATKPEIFGRLVGNNIGYTQTGESMTDKFELETEKFHIKVTFPGPNYRMEILKQDPKIGSHFWISRNYGSTEFEVWSNCYIRHGSPDHRKIMLGGVDSDKSLNRSSASATVKEDTCHNKAKVLSMLDDLKKYVLSKPDIFGTPIGSTSSTAAPAPEVSEFFEIETPKFHLKYTHSANGSGVMEILKQHRDIGRYFWSVQTQGTTDIGTYSNCGFASETRLRLGGVDSDRDLSSSTGARRWSGRFPLATAKIRLQDLVTFIYNHQTLFGELQKHTGLTVSGSPTPAAMYPTFSFKSENLEVEAVAEHKKVTVRVTKQTAAVTSRCSGSEKPDHDGISIVSAGTPEIASGFFFLAGKTQSPPASRTCSVSWSDSPESANAQLTKHFNALMFCALADTGTFGRVLHTSWTETPTSTVAPTPTEAPMPTFVADPNTLTIETAGLRLEIKYLDSRKALMSIPRQQSSIGNHLWSAKFQDGVRFEVDSDWTLKPGRLYLRPSTDSGRDLKSESSKVFDLAPKFSKTLEAMIALRKYIKANIGVFGSYIGDNLESVPAMAEPAPFDVSVMQHFVKFQNFHIGMSVSSSEVTINIPVQTAGVTEVFSRGLSTGTFTFKSVTQPEYKLDDPKIYVCGDEDDVTEATRHIRDESVDHRLRIATALLELVRTASSIPEFGPLLDTNVGPAELRPALAETVATPVAETSKYAALGMNMLAVNKTAAIIESKRQLGKVILGQAQSRVGENLPDLMKPIFNTPLGKILVANTLVVATEYYTGPHKDKVSVVTESVLSAAASDVGDWLDINGILDGFINAVKK